MLDIATAPSALKAWYLAVALMRVNGGAKLLEKKDFRVAARKLPVHTVADAGVSTVRRAFLSSLVVASITDAASAYAAVDALQTRLQEALSGSLKRVLVASAQVHARELPILTRTAEGFRSAKGPLKNPYKRTGMRFDVANPKSVAWASERAAQLVVDVVDGTRKLIQILVSDGIANGRTIKQTAKLLRETIGLTERQGESLLRYRDKLEEQGYADADIDDEVSARAGRMINDRADMIAHHETMVASNVGQEQLWEQAVEEGYLTGMEVRSWILTDDDRLCPACAAMEGKTAPIGGAWTTDAGVEIETPQDIHVGCRCTEGLELPSITGAAKWNPTEHPRAKSGEFAKSSGASSAVVRTETALAELQHEELHAFDAEGNDIGSAIGGLSDAALGEGLTVKLQSAAHGTVTLTHNHPQGGSFSADDINIASRYNLAEIRAVAKNATYSLKPGREGWPKSVVGKPTFAGYMAKTTQELESKYGDRRELQHAVMTKVAKNYGLQYERTSR